MQVVLEMDEAHLEILLTQIEGMFSCCAWKEVRNNKLIDREVELAVHTWNGKDDGDFQFAIVKIAPVYRQLLRYHKPMDTRALPPREALFAFVEALRLARTDSTQPEVNHAN